MSRFLLTFEVITPESAEHGEAAQAGVLEESATLRDAFEEMRFAEAGIEASDYPATAPRWITARRTREDFETGEVGNVTLHFPESTTPASRRRVLRLLESSL